MLATRIAAGLARDPDVDAAEVAGPGFINLRLTALPIGMARFAASSKAGPSSAAPTGAPAKWSMWNMSRPIRPGRCISVIAAGAVFGDALANLLAAAGYAVTREYYINDAGAQVDALARSAFLRYREALGEPIGDIPEGLYPGDYLIPVGAALAREHGRALLDMSPVDWLPIVRDDDHRHDDGDDP